MSNITRQWMEPTFGNPEGSILRTPSSEHSYKHVDPSHRWPTGGISNLIQLKGSAVVTAEREQQRRAYNKERRVHDAEQSITNNLRGSDRGRSFIE